MAASVAPCQMSTPVPSKPSPDMRDAKRPRIDDVDPVMDALKPDATALPVVAAEHVENVQVPTPPHEPDDVFLGSIDQGTTSSRFIIFNRAGEPVEAHQIEFENLYPNSGWHEHDPMELLSTVEECIEETMLKFSAKRPGAKVHAVGITNQRETTVVWDTETGEPLYNAVVWPDTRTSHIVHELRTKPGADELLGRCGLPLSTYPSSVKLLWLLRNVDSVKDAYEAGRLAFGTVDSWLIYRLTGKKVHVTDGTNASRTMFMDLHSMAYDQKLLSFFDIDASKIHLPEIVPSAHPTAFGSFAAGPLRDVRIAGCLGDQSSALVGQCAFESGQAKNTYGTGCFLLYNVGPEPVISKAGLLATVAYDFGPELGGRAYALEGSVAVAGSGVKFLANNLGFAPSSADITALAASVEDNGGVVFVTAFSGLFAPYWIDDAKGTLFGITQHTQKGHIARATLEATCYQTKAILDAMERDSGRKLATLAVDGGMSGSDLCMQIQADVSGIPVDRPQMRETTALGAAIAAGLATGVWRGLDDLRRLGGANRSLFVPAGDRARAERMFRKWEQAVEMSKGWVREDDDEQ